MIKEKIVYTAGTFDNFHIGHLNMLKKAKELGNVLIVAVSTDELVASYKGTNPVIPYEQREKIVENCKYVDKVVKQTKLLDPKQMKKLKINVLAANNDWKNKYIESFDWAKNNNIEVKFLPYTKGFSSTTIRRKTLSLKGKNVLITGGSSGIGASIVEKFAETETNIGLHYFKDENLAKKLKEKLEKKYNAKIVLYKRDLRTSPKMLFFDFIRDFKHIDILVNNAGIVSPINYFDLDEKDFDNIFAINSKAPFFLSQIVFKEMQKHKSGKIINISSIATKFGMGRNGSIQYAATKATLNVLTKGLSKLGAPHNILVNSISPSIILTRIHNNRKDLQERINLIPLKRAGNVEDVSNFVIYLCSEKGNFITGQNFIISGGE